MQKLSKLAKRGEITSEKILEQPQQIKTVSYDDALVNIL
jgi:hypothetical protein